MGHRQRKSVGTDALTSPLVEAAPSEQENGSRSDDELQVDAAETIAAGGRTGAPESDESASPPPASQPETAEPPSAVMVEASQAETEERPFAVTVEDALPPNESLPAEVALPEALSGAVEAPPETAAPARAEVAEPEHESPILRAAVHEATSAPHPGILCRVVGPGAVAGHGVHLDGRTGHYWEPGSRGYFSPASVTKLPHLLRVEPTGPR